MSETRIAQATVELAEPALVGAGEKPQAREERLVPLEPVALAEPAEPPIDERAIEGARWCNDGDSHARTERLRQKQREILRHPGAFDTSAARVR